MSKCESNVNELIVPELAGIPGTVSSRLSDFRDCAAMLLWMFPSWRQPLRTLRFAG